MRYAPFDTLPHLADTLKDQIGTAEMRVVAASSLNLLRRLMKIAINAEKDEVLGGPDHIPYLKLELSEDGNAILCAGHCHLSQHMAPIEEWSGCTRIWTASLSPGSYALADPVAIGALAERLKPLLVRVAAGHSVHRGGPEPCRPTQ